MTQLRWIALLVLAGLGQVFLPQVWAPLGAIDWLLIVVVHQALQASFRRAVIFGAAAGLVQDGLSSGIVGLHAFAKTIVSAVISSFGTLLVVRGPVPQAVFVVAAALLENAIVIGWQFLLAHPASLGLIDIPVRALTTGVATIIVLSAIRRAQRPGASRRPRRRKEFRR